jgi:hypothetical protein
MLLNPKLDKGQLEAVQKLRNGNILCGEVGSGKSRAGLAYYFCKVCGGMINGKDRGYESDYVPMKRPIDLYIITTAKKRDKREWDDEMTPFLLSTDPKFNYYSEQISVVVDSWNNIEKYIDVSGAFFIFDEQRVVGYGKWSKSFIKISKHNQWIFLSATPGDCWMDYLSIFIANGFFRNKTDFVSRHVIYSRYSKFPKVDQYVNEKSLERMRDNILVNIDYTKPTERHYETILVDYDREQYRTLMRERWNVYEKRPIENISELCYLLRKTVNADPSRIEACVRISELNNKLIIFYNFDYELEILKNAPWPEGTEIREWNGHKHQEIFDSERWVYLVQYSAGAEGWNCILTNAILFYSPSYSYKTTEQAMGRIDRRNTPFHDLYYYSFKTYAPIDIAISRALKRKKNFNETAFFSTKKS